MSRAPMRRARPRTPKQLERQFVAFQRSVAEGRTIRQIAQELGVNKDTVVADIRFEADRRQAELEERREYELTNSVAFYEGIIVKALRKSQMNDALVGRALADSSGKTKATVTDRTLSDAIDARERIDKLFGLEAPARFSIEAELLEAIDLP